MLKGAAGNEEVFAIDSAGTLWQKWYTPGAGVWSGWLSLGAPTGSALQGKPWVLVSAVSGNEEVFARDQAGGIWEKWYTPSTGVWSGWFSLGSPGSALASDPIVLKGATGNEDVYSVDSAGTLWQKWYTPGAGVWSGWFSLGAPA